MNTLLVTTEFPPIKGGVANYYSNLVNSWPEAESLSVLHNGKGGLVSNGRLWPWRRAFKAIGKKLNSEKIDYVLVGQVLPLGTVVWVLSFFKNFRYAVFFHGMDLSYSLRRSHKRLLTNLIIKRADKIICANNYVKGQLDACYPSGSQKAIISNPGIPLKAPKTRDELLDHIKINYGLGEGSGMISLLTLGRLVKRKGVDKVIAALNGLPEEILSRLRYFIAGSGPEEEYLKSLIPAKLKDKIIFLGEIKDDEKWAWLKLCDIFIMPSRDIKGDYEGFGIVYLEANLCGKPVIAGRAGGVADAVEDGYSGLLVNPEDEADIRAAIIKLAADGELRDRLGRQGYERAIKEFNWPELAHKLYIRLRDSIL